MINANKSYRNWKAFTFKARGFLALERAEGWEIYEGPTLEPRYLWMSIENFKKDAKAGRSSTPVPAPINPQGGQK